MSNYSKVTRPATVVAVMFVFMAFVGLGMAIHRFLMDFDPKLDLIFSLGCVVIGAFALAKNHGRNRAKECATNFGLIYISLFMEPVSRMFCFFIGIGLYVYEWLRWEKECRFGSIGCYSRWMTYNILILSFLLAGNILFFLKYSVDNIILGCVTVLWLAMIVRLSLRLKQ